VSGFKTRYTDGARRGFYRVGVVLARRGATADMLTILGLLLQIAAVPLIVSGHFKWALLVGGVGAVCDALDGAVARAGAGATKAGAFLDSTTDRLSELVISGALVFYFARHDDWWPTAAVLIFMGAAQMVSYSRARAEALGVECKVGFMSRPERMVGLGLGFLFSGWHIGDVSVLVLMVYLLVALTSLTVWQRVRHVMRSLREPGERPIASD
jgi:CDP-diacylglycerol--glycerol-3-phosphate 3-phosphatidyltransferase